MNPPHRSAVPAYRKWYFGAGGSPGRGAWRQLWSPIRYRLKRSGSMTKEPWGRRARRRTGTARTGHSPSRKGRRAKTLRHLLALPWGGRLGKPGSKGLRRQRGGAGGSERKPADGGRTGRAQIPHGDWRGAASSGTYSWEVSQTNIDYNPASGNTSICNYSIDVVPTEPGAGKNPNRVPARETRATTAAERRPPRRRPGRALRRAWKAAPWETTARRGAA